MLDSYYQQVCHHMRNSDLPLYPSIVHSILGSFLLEVLGNFIGCNLYRLLISK